ncbi:MULTISPECIES: SDR family NAD(P)-dependent oxidoreductase [Roseateles]|uniref:NAD(P)-dependent dehydrogenase (Short-subunit alcohol dehydrogenase family) n=1 Tax=Pelomonas aquatica TaxID=431058 RepID=A0ABU1ZAV2_9BURK|nr:MULTISPECIES: SDR family NAD(P)-dependent oxidoreductase [Roseateles]KQY90464.1 short-chain dehydrogenase [Pelomonas sp. Root1444]MDR7297105.1 NAD(P)-dependent dehydrogenase (short-subunit alcohol dehydrogenase family) [Pelomonas aquatica]
MSLNPRLQDWHGRTAWLIGASTGIGRATASALHTAGARVIVSARQAPLLNEFVALHAGSHALPLDVMDLPALQAAAAEVGTPDLCVYCAGYYRPMSATGFDLADARRHLDINYVGALNLLDALLPQLLMSGRGHLSLVSSVAGYRGLPKALAYGPGKAALTHLAEALYLDLHPRGIGVSVIHPGFVTTPMTAQNDFRMPAEISAAQAARSMLAGWAAGEFEIHFPKRFTRFMKALRLLPDSVYFNLVSRANR